MFGENLNSGAFPAGGMWDVFFLQDGEKDFAEISIPIILLSFAFEETDLCAFY